MLEMQGGGGGDDDDDDGGRISDCVHTRTHEHVLCLSTTRTVLPASLGDPLILAATVLLIF